MGLIVKAYEKSIHIEAMKTLLKRLPVTHASYAKVSKEIWTTTAGDLGEDIVFRELEKVRLPYNHAVFHKLLLYAENAFELDILLLTPFGAVILEVKNITGELEFFENPAQLVQTKDNGDINKYSCPATQLNEYKYQLQQFFTEQNMPIPIHGAVVFAFQNSFVKNSTKKATILHRNEVRHYLRNLQNNTPILGNQEIERLKEILLKKNNPYMHFPLTKYFSLNPNDLIRGVECLKCGFIGMQKMKRTWFCPKCRTNDALASGHTISSYFLINKDSISNKECREFLLLNNSDEAKRILSSSELVKIGEGKTTHYKMKPIKF